MLVDNAPLDLSEFIHADLFHTSPASASSSPSSPSQGLLTPPQCPAPSSFSDAPHHHHDALNPFALFDDDLKLIDPLLSSFDFGPSSLDHPISGYALPTDVDFPSLAGLSMNLGGGGSGMGLNMPMSSISEDPLQQMSIDPQLVDTPASTSPLDDFDNDDSTQDGDDEDSSQNSSAIGTPPAASAPAEDASTDRERLTLTIAPVKVGGHGKARKGTVQSGGIVKKSATSSIYRDKENAISSVLFSSGAHSAAGSASAVAAAASPTLTKNPHFPKPPAILKASNAKKSKAKGDLDEDDDDDVPHDWRPSPEVFAKMTSKEKRQLRNKISARNFRVRRKEYISTLEGDIAERDRLLEAIQSELGSTQSENLALRQEIAALKKVLLDGRGAADLPLLNLPPPAPLPVGLSAAATAAANNTTTITSSPTSAEGMGVPSPPTTPAPANATVSTAANPFAPNTQKDLPSSPMPRNGGAFWGGQRQMLMGSGFTPVHTALVPEVNPGLWGWNGSKQVPGDRAGSNINPLLNVIGAGVSGQITLPEKKKEEEKLMTGFEAFADANLFTMKSLDAYRMQLWGKMAAQHHVHQHLLAQQQQHQASHHQQQQLSGLAAALRPHHFTAPSLSPKTPAPSASVGLGGTLAALLSGKQAPTASGLGLLTPPASPKIGAQGSPKLPSQQPSQQTQQQQQQQQREAQAAMLAVVASQTLFKKLGSAFWDAFSGSSSSLSTSTTTTTAAATITSTTSSSAIATRSWDAEKVRKVLEGTAVVRVVDVEPATVPVPVPAASTCTTAAGKVCEDVKGCVNEILEESMRSLTLGKGSGSGLRRH